MPLDSSLVGESTPPLKHTIDARWLMAYAASLNDLNPAYMDTAASTVIAHPVFPVCVEWPVILNARKMAAARSLKPEENARGVHATHDLHIFRPVRDGDQLITRATVIEVRRIRPGAAFTMRLDTTTADTDELIARTYQTSIYRETEVSGDDDSCETTPALPESGGLQDLVSAEIFIPQTTAHIYTECARIWNPIHTDRAVALSAGLPDIILHGTATLALAVSRITTLFAEGDPTRVARLGGRFSAMVMMPSTVTLQARRKGNSVSFQVLTEDGKAAISDGFVSLV